MVVNTSGTISNKEMLPVKLYWCNDDHICLNYDFYDSKIYVIFGRELPRIGLFERLYIIVYKTIRNGIKLFKVAQFEPKTYNYLYNALYRISPSLLTVINTLLVFNVL